MQTERSLRLTDNIVSEERPRSKPRFKKKKKSRAACVIRRILLVLLTVILAVLAALLGVVYVEKGPSETARNLFVISCRETSAIKWVPNIFLSNEQVELIAAQNAIQETDDITDPGLVKIPAPADIKEAAGSSRLRESILFEQAHYAAKRMAPQAAELLANFITLAETPALKTQARLDQVEVALNLNPPDLETVQAILPLLEKEQLSPEQTMQLARLNILEAESRQEWPNAIQSCRRAIALDSEGKQADMLYLKLGELLYKNGDFHEAQLVLQPFPSKYPDSPLQAAALFLAGKAAQQSNTGSTLNAALNIFKTLGTGDTPFAQPARIEEASVLLRMGKADQCIAALENLLSSPLPRYMRLLALSIQADAWVAKEDTHSDTLCKAINLCTEILDTPNLGLAWKFKALTQRAQFYERMNEQKKALDDYASILAHTPSGSSANKRRDWHWFYNAGFASIRLLGQLQDWDGALALAKKLAQTSGPRAREAAAYARRIQLEHFIWQDEPEASAPENGKPATPDQTAD